MKRVLLGLIAVVTIFATYFAVSPYLAMHGLKSAIKSGDSAALGDRVDFPRVRENLKGQFNATMLKTMRTSELKDNPFGAVAFGLASKLAEGMVDSFITPEVIANLARGEKPHTESSGREDVFSNARVTRESLDRFSVWVPHEQGEDVRFIFHRYGLGWKLTGISIPLDETRTGKMTQGSEDPRPRATLDKLAAEINRGVPVMVDKETELLAAVGTDGMLIYNYRLVSYSVSQLDTDKFAAGAKKRVTQGACNRPETRDDLLKHGVTLRYSYFDKDKQHIATVDVTASDCGFAPLAKDLTAK